MDANKERNPGPSPGDYAISVCDLSISFSVPMARKRTRFSFMRENFFPVTFKDEELKALQHLNFHVKKGECVGIIGENGSGKSTLLKAIAGILMPDSGNVTARGKVAPFLELGVGFQGELTARENVFIFGALMGIPKKRMNSLLPGIITFAGLEEFTNVKIKNFSSGMYARLAFSCVVSVEPDILLIDEVFAVGDEAFRHRCINRLLEFKNAGNTILLVSHRLGDIRSLCDRLLLLTGGKIAAEGKPDDIISYYLDSFVSEEKQIRERGAEVIDKKVFFRSKSPGDTEGIIREIRLSKPQVRTGEDLSVKIDLNAVKEIEGPQLILQIFKQGGPLVFGTNTVRDGFALPRLKGCGKIGFLLKKIQLLSGEYYINIELWGGPLVECLEKHERCCGFSVLSKKKDGTGILKMEHGWETTDG